MKYITNLGVDDTIKNKIVVKAEANHDSVKKVFDLNECKNFLIQQSS